MTRPALVFALVLAVAAAGCPEGRGRPGAADASSVPSPGAGEEEPCPAVLPAPHLLPGSRPEHRQPGFWIARAERPDDVLLDRGQIEELNRRARALSDGGRLGARADLLAGPAEAGPVVAEMSEALLRHRERAAAGERVFLDGERPADDFFDAVDLVQRGWEAAAGLRLATAVTPIRCHPSERGLYEHEGDVDFDLFLCSNAHPGDVVQVASRHPGGWALVRTAYAIGWAREETLGPEISDADARRYLAPERFVVVRRDRVPVWASTGRTEQQAAVDLGLRLPLLGRDPSGLVQVLAPSPDGLAPGFVEADDVNEAFLPLTRRNVIRQAFERLDDRFGWGDDGGDRDCSRFLMDLFALFGLELPRNSYWQSMAGSSSTEVTGLAEPERAAALDRALGQGIVLLYMPGHIMMLLGREGEDYHAIHQFSGYRVGCRPGQDVKMAVDRVAVTTLRLGEGSERRSFMERFTHVVVIGGSASPPVRP